MLKKLMLSLACLGALAAGTAAAEAKAKVNVFIGGDAGYHDECYDRYSCGYEDRSYRYRDDDDYDFEGGYAQVRIRDTLSCKEAGWMLTDRGYRNIVARDCQGVSYVFTARKRGITYKIRINSGTGRINSLRPIVY